MQRSYYAIQKNKERLKDDNINKKEELLPIEFLINCKLEKCFLEENKIKIVALTLLQVIYIDELNNA